MKKTSLIAALALMLALCLGLVGCGSSLEPEDATNFHGTWELVSGDGETEEDVLAEADVAMLKEYGMTCTLTLNEDGTGNMDLFGEKTEATWVPADEVTGTVTLEGQDADASIDDAGKLTIDQDGSTLLFVKAA